MVCERPWCRFANGAPVKLWFVGQNQNAAPTELTLYENSPNLLVWTGPAEPKRDGNRSILSFWLTHTLASCGKPIRYGVR